MRRRAAVTICSAAVFLAACAMAPPERPVYRLPAGMAGLFVLNRSERAVFNAKQSVTDGDKAIAEVAPRRYAFAAIAPGAHELHCADLSLTREVELTAAAGETYYLLLEMVGSPQVQRCRLIAAKEAQEIFRNLLPQAEN